MRHAFVSDAHSRRDVLRVGAVSAVGLALSERIFPGSDSAVAAPGTPGVPQSAGPLRSAGVLAFAADNVLFVGDITGAAVHAFSLREKDLTPQNDVELGNFHNFEGRDLVRGLDQKLAALFGTTYDKIVVNDMVVHQLTQQIFLSVERGGGMDAVPAIVKVNHGNLSGRVVWVAHSALFPFGPNIQRSSTPNGRWWCGGIRRRRIAWTSARS